MPELLKKLLPFLISFLTKLLAILAKLVADKHLVNGEAKKEEVLRQEEDQKVLDEKLKDKDEEKESTLRVIDVNKEIAEQKAKAAHEERNEDIKKTAEAEAAAVPVDSLPDSLLHSLNSATKKLNG
jgi:phage protein D